MFDIIPVITIPHTGTQTIVYQIDPKGADKLVKLAENNELTIDEFRNTEYNYILLEYLSSNWGEFKDSGGALVNHSVIDRNRKNIVYGHIVPHDKRTTFLDSLACIQELNEQYGIIMTMRDPLLSIISTMTRDIGKRKDKGYGGGFFAPMGEWIRYHMMPEIYGFEKPEKPSIQVIKGTELSEVLKESGKPPAQSIAAKFAKTEESPSLKTLDDFLYAAGRIGRKEKIPGSEYIKASNYEIKGQLFMWDLWAKHIHKLKPYYIPMDLDNKQGIVYKGIDFKDLKHHNSTGHNPLKKAYYDRDILYLAKELKSNLGSLINLESVLRPPLEELGYRDLLWWSL